MAKVRVKSHISLSLDEILDGISQLGNSELEHFMGQIGNLIAQRKAPSFSKREAELLLKINKGIPKEKLARYNILSDKFLDKNLTEQEHQELLRISNQMEERDAERVKELLELANLRSVSLDSLMQELGLSVSEDV